MTGRSLSVLALTGALSSLVLVATFAEGVAAADSASDGSMAAATTAAVADWTRFEVRPATPLVGGGLAEAPLVRPPMAVSSRPRAFFWFVRNRLPAPPETVIARRGD